MKAFRTIAAIAASAALFVGCTAESGILEIERYTLKASIDKETETRLSYEGNESFDAAISPVWSEGDKIRLTCITSSGTVSSNYDFTLTAGAGSSEAEFESTSKPDFSGSGTLYAGYPYLKLLNSSTTPTTFNVLSSTSLTQKSDNGIDHLLSYNIMMAEQKYSNGALEGDIKFKNLLSIITVKINLPEGNTVTPGKVVYTLEDGAFIVSKYYNFASGTTTPKTVSPTLMVELTTGEFKTSDVTVNYILPDQDLTDKTIKVYVYGGTDNATLIGSGSFNGTAFGTGKRYYTTVSLNEKPDFGTYDESTSTWTVTTYDQLKAIATACNGGNGFAKQTIKLGADIDLGSKEWVPIGNSVSGFKGSFDGCGHTISGLKITSGIYDYVGLFGITNGSNAQNLSVIKNLTVSGEINIDRGQSPVSALCVGGIVGQTYTSSYGCNLTSNVNITVKGYNYITEVYLVNVYAGGVIGRMATSIADAYTSEGTLAHNGNITVSGCKARLHVGGVCGEWAQTHVVGTSDKVSFVNKGNISVTGETSGDTRFYLAVGGILGRANTKAIHFTSMSEEGDITTTTPKFPTAVGGLIGLATTSIASEENAFTGEKSFNGKINAASQNGWDIWAGGYLGGVFSSTYSASTDPDKYGPAVQTLNSGASETGITTTVSGDGNAIVNGKMK